MPRRPPPNHSTPVHDIAPPDPVVAADPPAGVRWHLTETPQYALLRVDGVLTSATAATLRAGLAKCLAAQPAAVLVDVAMLRIQDHPALSVFAGAAREAAQWPGAPLAFVRPAPETAEHIGRSAVCRHLPVFPSVEDAVAHTVDPKALSELSRRLQPVVGAARQARELVTEACARWDLPQLIGPACTVVTELVNNVVVHARTPMEVVLRRRGRHVHLSVLDGSPDVPVARGPASPTSPGGRGLMMVGAVAEGWGYRPVAGGKVVWALLRTDDAPAGA